MKTDFFLERIKSMSPYCKAWTAILDHSLDNGEALVLVQVDSTLRYPLSLMQLLSENFFVQWGLNSFLYTHNCNMAMLAHYNVMWNIMMRFRFLVYFVYGLCSKKKKWQILFFPAWLSSDYKGRKFIYINNTWYSFCYMSKSLRYLCFIFWTNSQPSTLMEPAHYVCK